MSTQTETSSKKKLQVLKALRHAVKRHELQLRECKLHLAPDLLNCLDELVIKDGESNFDVLAEKFQETTQLLETATDAICSNVEQTRETINKKTQQVMDKAYESFTNLLMSVKELLETNEKCLVLKKNCQREADEHSKQLFATDDEFKKLVEEKNELSSKTTNFRNEIRQFDLEQISKLEETCERLQKTSLSLSHCVNVTLPEEHQKLDNSSHLDEIAEESLNFLQSISQSDNDLDLTEFQENKFPENNLHKSITKEHVINELFGSNTEPFFKTLGGFKPKELEGIQKALDQRHREFHMIQRLGQAINASQILDTNSITEILENSDTEQQLEKPVLSQVEEKGVTKTNSPVNSSQFNLSYDINDKKKYAPHQVLSFQHNTQ